MNTLRLSSVALLAIISSSFLSSEALAGVIGKANCDTNGCNTDDSCNSCCDKIICPKPCGYCVPEYKCVDIKKTCFKVECKTICIPAITFPWERRINGCCSDCCDKAGADGRNTCGPTKCGKVISVRSIKKSSMVVGKQLVCNWKHIKCHACSNEPCDAQQSAPAADGIPPVPAGLDSVPPPPATKAARIYLPSRILQVSRQIER